MGPPHPGGPLGMHFSEDRAHGRGQRHSQGCPASRPSDASFGLNCVYKSKKRIREGCLLPQIQADSDRGMGLSVLQQDRQTRAPTQKWVFPGECSGAWRTRWGLYFTASGDRVKLSWSPSQLKILWHLQMAFRTSQMRESVLFKMFLGTSTFMNCILLEVCSPVVLGSTSWYSDGCEAPGIKSGASEPPFGPRFVAPFHKHSHTWRSEAPSSRSFVYTWGAKRSRGVWGDLIGQKMATYMNDGQAYK